MNASAILTRALFLAVQPSATKIRRFTEASSRKSMLSANSDTELIARATLNSTPKQARFTSATHRTMRRSPLSVTTETTEKSLSKRASRKHCPRDGQPGEHAAQRQADRENDVARRQTELPLFVEQRGVEREGREGGKAAQHAGD